MSSLLEWNARLRPLTGLVPGPAVWWYMRERQSGHGLARTDARPERLHTKEISFEYLKMEVS
jgi:hypothetical protein